jgi:haloalkane dehalogenase
MALVSTPAERFSVLPEYEYEPSLVSVGEPDVAYVDVNGDGDETFLCLHGEPTWGFLYRKMIPRLRDRGRVVVPDFVGFGRSDKYDSIDEYSYDMHAETLATFVEELDLTGVTLVCQDWGSILGLPLAVSKQPDRFDRVVAMNALLCDGETELPEVWHQFRDMVVTADDLAAYENPFFALFSDADPITRAFRDRFRELVPTASEQPDVWVANAGHFLQEDAGAACADHVVEFVDRT